jgi:proteasome lid subunit RPN8/RPN11
MSINERLLSVYSQSPELCTRLSNLDIHYLSPSMDWHLVLFIYFPNFPFWEKLYIQLGVHVLQTTMEISRSGMQVHDRL